MNEVCEGAEKMEKMAKVPDIKKMKNKARWVRQMVLESVAAGGKGHIGGTYSCTDLFVALYYGGILRVDPAKPGWADRDRLLVGKGHACLALYAIFMDLGFIDRSSFDSYGRDGGLGGQLDIEIPGVEYNTGSLGHVLGIAAGMALAAKMDAKDYRAYALMGDAECYEGSIWEAIIFAGEHGLDKLVGIIDRNRLSVTEVLEDDGFFEDFSSKLQLFGWDAYDIDGHSLPEIMEVFEAIKKSQKPVMIIANTIKGKGVSFMENGVHWHHGVPNESELAQARKELESG
jgi:transketolase